MLILSLCGFTQENYQLIAYIPSDGEIQYLMNLYERLKSFDNNTQDYTQLGSMYKTFENVSDKYYSTYQRLLFESYLLKTKNEKIQNYISSYINQNNLQDNFSSTLNRLYQGKPEQYTSNNQKYERINISGNFIDEEINLFNMKEITVFNNDLGLMLFDNNWTIVNIKDDITNEKNISLIYGGGTNSIAIYIKQTTNISFNDFKMLQIDGKFYKEKYSDYQVIELPNEGILGRSGADHIFLGVGSGADIAFKDIDNFSAVMFIYSEKNQTGYKIDYFMNISPKNNNYQIRNDLFNHLLFQNLMSFINN